MRKTLTQEEKMLIALKEASPNGLHPTYFVVDLHVYQYGRAINTLRKGFNCECKNGFRCSAQEHIYNKRMSDGTTCFFYEKSGSHVDWEKMRKDTVEKLKESEVVENGLF